MKKASLTGCFFLFADFWMIRAAQKRFVLLETRISDSSGILLWSSAASHKRKSG